MFSYIVTLKKGVNPQSFIHVMTHDDDCYEIDSPYKGTDAAVIPAQRINQVGRLAFYLTDQP